MSEPTNPRKSYMRSPNSTFNGPLQFPQQGLPPEVGGVVNQDPDMLSLMSFLQGMSQRGTLPPGFHMSMGLQGSPEEQMAQFQQQPLGMQQPQMAAGMPQGMPPQGMPGMGQMPSFGMQPGMSPFATMQNALAPTPSIGAQMYGQPMGDAQQVRAADLGMQPGPMQRFRDSLSQFGQQLRSGYEQDPGRFFRTMAAVSTGRPAAMLAQMSDEAKMAESAALRREQVAARSVWEREQNQTRLDAAQIKVQQQQDLADAKEIARANLRAEKFGLPDRAVSIEDLPDLSQKIGEVEKRQAMNAQADKVIGRALRGFSWMPREIAKYFADDPEFGKAVQDAAMKAQLMNESLRQLREATRETRTALNGQLRLSNNAAYQIAMTDLREASSEMAALQAKLASVAGQDFMDVGDDLLDQAADLQDRIADIKAQALAAAQQAAPAPGKPAGGTAPGGTATKPKKKGSSLREAMGSITFE